MPLQGAWWKLGTGILMAYVIYGAFGIANGVVGFGQGGDKARIIFFHVPSAILSSVCYLIGSFYAFRYLRSAGKRQPLDDARSAINMELGFLFCLLATVTGSIFAHVQWGSYWNWDPRETSILGMLLIYGSYLVLRGAVNSDPERRARYSAAYALIGIVPSLFLIWVMPRIPSQQSLHPPDTLIRKENTSISYKAVLYPSFLSFTMVYCWLFQLRLRSWILLNRRGLD